MERTTIERLATDPVGCYVAGDGYAHFCASADFWGVVFWGRPSVDTARLLGRSLVLELDAPAVPHVSIIDASRLEGADTTAFQALQWYMRTYSEALERQVKKLALVRPSGLEGAIVAGIYDVLPRPYPVEVFDNAKDALLWLDVAESFAPQLALNQAMKEPLKARIS